MERQQADEPVGRLASVSYSRFRSEYSRPSRPLIIEDFTVGWKAHGLWNTEYFLQNYGDRVVSSERNQPTKLGDAVNDAIESNDDDQRTYLSNVHIAAQLPELLDELSPFPEILSRSYIASRFMPPRWRDPNSFLQLYIGGRGSGFGILHYDVMHLHAFITQIRGEKEFTLIPPEDTGFVYPQDAYPNLSSIPDIEHVDHAKFPEFRKARITKVRLGPGQSIFVPGGWWHCTKILSPSISVSFSGLDSGNWSQFRTDFSEEISDYKPHRRLLINAYMIGLGTYFACRELMPRSRR